MATAKRFIRRILIVRPLPDRLVGAAFPIDMLRYARCVPHSGRDSNLIEQSAYGSVHEPVMLYRYSRDVSARMPENEVARWRAYGWEIVENRPDDI